MLNLQQIRFELGTSAVSSPQLKSLLWYLILDVMHVDSGIKHDMHS